MSLENGEFISDLDQTNPISGDQVAEGDNHLRLIKKVLRQTFPNASKAIYFPDSVVKTAAFAITAADMNKTFMVDTTAGNVALTLPALVSTDAGWVCYFVKTNAGTNPILISPPSGSILSGDQIVSTTRRCIPGKRFSAYWSGSNWAVERNVGVPVGSIIDFDGATLPTGFELPNGQTLAGTAGSLYPDYYTRKGSLVTRDLTGRIVAMKEATATRLTAALGGVDGATLGAAGGGEGATLLQANLPNVTLTTSIAAGQGSHTHTSNAATAGGNNFDAGPYGAPNSGVATINANTLPAMTGTTPLGGSATPLTNVQPTIVLNKILVVE